MKNNEDEKGPKAPDRYFSNGSTISRSAEHRGWVVFDNKTKNFHYINTSDETILTLHPNDGIE